MGSRESDHQAGWFTWARTVRIAEFPGKTLYDFSFAVPNGALLAGNDAQRARYMNFLKKQGLKNGVSDVVIALPRGPYHGAYMEFKRDNASKVTDAQDDWIALMNIVGYHASIVRGYEQSVAFAQGYLKS